MVSVGRGSLGQSASCHEKGSVALTRALEVFNPCLAWGKGQWDSYVGHGIPQVHVTLAGFKLSALASPTSLLTTKKQ